MSDYLLLYLFTRLDALSIALGVCAVVSGTVAAIMCLIYAMENGEVHPKWRQFVAVPCVLIALLVIIPGQKDMAIIVGGKIALDVGRSDTAQEIGQEVLDAIRAQLREAKE